MTFRLRAAILLALLAAPAAALAQDADPPSPEAVALARELMAGSMPSRADYPAMFSTQTDVLVRHASGGDAQATDHLRRAMIQVFDEHVDELLDVSLRQRSDYYARKLSVEELKAAIVFERSPAGRAMHALQPEELRLQNDVSSRWMGALLPELQSRIVAASVPGPAKPAP